MANKAGWENMEKLKDIHTNTRENFNSVGK